MRKPLVAFVVFVAVLFAGVAVVQGQGASTPPAGSAGAACASPVASPSASPAATMTMTATAAASPSASPAACASPVAGGSTQATLEMVDIAFKPKEFTISANTDVTVTLNNTGSTAHNFSVTDHNNPNVKNLNISVDVAPGQTQTVTINAPAGDYYFYCNVPGHEAAGMSGTMHVQ